MRGDHDKINLSLGCLFQNLFIWLTLADIGNNLNIPALLIFVDYFLKLFIGKTMLSFKTRATMLWSRQ